jgi:hypothetical protein
MPKISVYLNKGLYFKLLQAAEGKGESKIMQEALKMYFEKGCE